MLLEGKVKFIYILYINKYIINSYFHFIIFMIKKAGAKPEQYNNGPLLVATK